MAPRTETVSQEMVRPGGAWSSARGLVRSIGLASDPRKIMLAVLGLVFLWAGWAALGRAFPSSGDVVPRVPGPLPLGPVRLDAEPIRAAALLVFDPLRVAFHPVSHALRLGGGTSRFAHAVLSGAWAMLVWGVIGAAIARVAALEVATGKRPSLWRGLKFALPRAPIAATVVVVPLVLALLPLALFGGLFGLLYTLPGQAGAIVAGALAWAPLLLGLFAAFLLLGFLAGWPLMIASVAVEAEDAFDALSRAYSYVFQRTSLLALLTGTAWAFGAAGVLLVALVTRVAVTLASWGVAVGAPDARVAGLFGPLDVHPESTASALHSGWMGLVSLLAYGWVYSFFWSSSVLIYLALRREVDGTPLDDIGPDAPLDETLVPEPHGTPTSVAVTSTSTSDEPARS
jgi:hypothetical protein